jgi:3-oxoacyl-(acyl-carrier-protein) synthase
MILSEGAGAVLLNRSGAIRLDKIVAGTNFHKQSEAGDSLEKIFAELGDGEIDLVVASANGTFIDSAEHAAVLRNCPSTKVLALKCALGESVGASSLWQTVCGAQSLRTQLVPPAFLLAEKNGARLLRGPKSNEQLRRVVILVCGLNQQVAGLRLTTN